MSQPDPRYFSLFATDERMSFVETGTYRGDGVQAALNAGFKFVHSVEAVKQYQERCSKRFEHQIRTGMVKIHLGGSEAILPKLSDEINAPIVYWLDAHTHGVKAEGDISNCPLNAEVSAIVERQRTKAAAKSDVILIDDVRVLVSPEWGNRVWGSHDVNFDDLIARIVANFRDHVLVYLDGIKPNDILAVIPSEFAEESLRIRASVRSNAQTAGN